jgi:recombination protein RecA
MPTAAALRIEIERALERRFPAALSPVRRTIHEVYETGIEAVDGLLGGGLPVGAISEVTGPAASGRTSLALAFLAQRTREGRACAWVDVSDALDPQSAAANGVRLRQLLWVRCGDKGAGDAIRHHSGANPKFVERQPQILGLQSPRRPPLRMTSTFKNELPAQDTIGARRQGQRWWWARLDQALRATDLLLQAGGFAAIVLDLGDTAPERANRIPLATWFRYRQAAERTQCNLLVLGMRAYAQSAAGVVLECEAARADVAGENVAGGTGRTSGTVLRGFQFAVRRGRERFAPVEIGTRKPPAATWQADAAWDAERGA